MAQEFTIKLTTPTLWHVSTDENGVQTLTLTEEAARMIYDGYRGHLDEEDVDNYIAEIEEGTILEPDGVTVEDLHEHKADLVDYYQYHRAGGRELEYVMPLLAAAVEDLAFELKYDRR